MSDPWADRIKLNPSLEVSKDDGVSIGGSTSGTIERDALDSASYKDISNTGSTKSLGMGTDPRSNYEPT